MSRGQEGVRALDASGENRKINCLVQSFSQDQPWWLGKVAEGRAHTLGEEPMLPMPPHPLGSQAGSANGQSEGVGEGVGETRSIWPSK